MAPYFPPPNKDTSLLPLLACLPIAFVSPQPPPALLPLLSPILRQRVKFLSKAGSSDSTWLELLCWDSADASELPHIVETVSFEPHPVSGEVEFGELWRVQYRKLDEETLQSILRLSDVGLEVIYLWCEGDQDGGEDGWRVNELRPLQDKPKDDSRPWYNTVSEADEKSWTDAAKDTSKPGDAHREAVTRTSAAEAPDVDDAYWAQYDQTQSQTPAQRLTPNPPPPYSGPNEDQQERDYYARYESIQPEMDNDDPSADRAALGHSSLNGNSLSGSLPPALDDLVQKTLAEVDLKETSQHPHDQLVHTRASSSSSSAVAQLEQSAQFQSQAEVAIQQHISTTMKSLYRLTRGAGIDISEFRRLVSNELDTIGMMDED